MRVSEKPSDLIVSVLHGGFLLRVRNAAGKVETHDLGMSFLGAVRQAQKMGFAPTHWKNAVGRISPIDHLPAAVL